jgi:hypothetical protein
MNRSKALTLAVLAAVGLILLLAAPPARAEVNVQIGIGVGDAPICPYGYYAVPPYRCAPYGYYGPEWFVGGVFLGAGPWFHGPAHFRGRVDRRYGPGYYRGPYPRRGDHPDWERYRHRNFRGRDWHDSGGKHYRRYRPERRQRYRNRY